MEVMELFKTMDAFETRFLELDSESSVAATQTRLFMILYYFYNFLLNIMYILLL